MLPTTWNLHRRKLTEDPICVLCGKPTNLEHILWYCQVRLTDGRFTQRHDRVLAQLVNELEKEKRRMTINTQTKGLSQARGEGRQEGWWHNDPWHSKGLQNERQLKFPEKVTITSLQPDIVLSFQAFKQVAPVELMVHCKEWTEEANERKQGKYQSLALEGQQSGRRVGGEPWTYRWKSVAGASQESPSGEQWKCLGSEGQPATTWRETYHSGQKQHPGGFGRR